MNIVSTERLLSTTFINIDLAKVSTSNGQEREHFIIDSINNGVAAIVVKKGKIILVKTKRLLWKKSQWEIPGGWMNNGEIARTAIRRKVEEETGYEVLDITRLGSTFSDIAMNTKEKFYFFVNVGNKIKDFNIDTIEIVSSFYPKEIDKLISKGNIIDERSLTGLMLAKNKGLI